MRRHVLEHVPFPAKVFHELAGQFHRVPLNTADTRHVALLNLRQQVVQTVPKFVEQGDDIVVREQGRFAVHAFGKVTDQMGHRRLQLAVVGAQPAGAHIVHPGTAAFAGAGRWV